MRKQPTLLVGGYIKTDLLDVNFIKALAIDAYTINTNTLFAKNIATASSAKRVEITSDLNNIRIFDASGNVLIELDDDAAFEGVIYHPNAVPPFSEYTFGPGIKVGSSAGQSGSLSRRGLTTTSGGVTQHSIGSDGSGNGKVELDIKAGMILKNVSYASAPGNASLFKNIRVYYYYAADGSPILTWSEV